MRAALDRIGDRWSLLVVSALLGGSRRFNDLSVDLGGIAPNVLAQRLRRLEADGLIVAEPYSVRPLRYAYALTATGAALAGALRLLNHWGAEHGLAQGRGALHQACGTAAEPRWFCGTCERMLEDGELDELLWV